MKRIWLRIINGRKKKILVMVSCILFMELFGCHHYESRGEYLAKVASKEDEQSDEMMQSIVNALEERDTEALKKLFSPYALEHAENLDEKIEELVNFYQGSDGGFEGNCMSHKSSNYGDIVLVLQGIYTLSNNNQSYEVNFVMQVENTDEPEKVGLFLIQIVKKGEEPEGYMWEDEESVPGIYVVQ